MDSHVKAESKSIEPQRLLLKHYIAYPVPV